MQNRKIKILEINAKPFFEIDEFQRQAKEVDNQWLEILKNINDYAVRWDDEINGKKYGFHVISKSFKKNHDFRITFFDKNSEPVSHSDFKMKDAGTGNYNDILPELPYSKKDYPVIIELEYINE